MQAIPHHNSNKTWWPLPSRVCQLPSNECNDIKQVNLSILYQFVCCLCTQSTIIIRHDPYEITLKMSVTCPICENNAMIAIDVCKFCGSLEGLDLIEGHHRSKKTLFGYDWANGSGAPYKTNDGSESYTTPKSLAKLAFENVNQFQILSDKSLVVDLGCGDAVILRTAATLYNCHCIGLDMDENAIDDSQKLIKQENLQHLITIEKLNFMEIDLLKYIMDIVNNANNTKTVNSVVITAYLLPKMLIKLKPVFIEILTMCQQVAIICFKWNIGAIEDLDASGLISTIDNKDSYTIYCREDLNNAAV
jgi:hypothetical protein